jgi:chromate reductase, NAD(P)H dehydrogenase (quinone)
MTETKLNVAAISGSLRAASYNTAALRAAVELAPPELDIEIYLLHEIPSYNADVEAKGFPAPVTALRDAITAADGILIATPEYNWGMPGVLKNAIDWLSRPSGKSVLTGKPLGVIGASPGTIGTTRAQGQLREVTYSNAVRLLPTNEVLIARAAEKFDASGRLTDKGTRDFLANMLREFAAWIRRFQT